MRTNLHVTVGLVLKQGSCTQEQYVNVEQFSALEGQTRYRPVAISSITSHVGHFDDVITCSNRDRGLRKCHIQMADTLSYC